MSVPAGMEQGIDFDALRAEVAKAHNVLLDRGDPIFVTVTLNNLVLAHFFARAEEAAAQIERQGAGAMAKQLDVVKTTSEKMIQGAAAYISEEVHKAGAAAQDRILASLDERVRAATEASKATEHAKGATMVAAAVACGAALLALGVTLGAALR